jgi:beta-phosphoglucomutase-like phosphatase (HAD superfamily)
MAEILLHFSLVEYFQVVVTSRDVQRPKPHPDMLLLAAERLALAPGEVLFVGDSELDREAAQGAGMPFIAYKGDGEESPAVAGHRELAERVLGEGEKGLFAF